MNAIDKAHELRQRYIYLISEDREYTKEEASFIKSVESGMGYNRAARKARLKLPKSESTPLTSDGEVNHGLSVAIKALAVILAIGFIIARGNVSFNTCFIAVVIYVLVSSGISGFIIFKYSEDPVERLRRDSKEE